MSINIPGFTPDLRNAQPSGLPSADRIATALERIADALEGCASDRACVAASWAPVPGMPGEWQAADPANRADGEVPTPEPEPEPTPCAATMPGHRCMRAEHADDRHRWTMTDEEYDRRREEAGVPRDVFDDVRAWADGREAAQRRLTAGRSDRGGECGQLAQTALGQIMTAIETGCDMVTYSLRPQSNAQQTVDAMHAAVALLRETVMRYTGPAATVDARSLETGEPVPVSVTVRKVCDAVLEDPILCQPDRAYRCTLHDGHEGYHDDGRGCAWGEVQASMTPDYASLIPGPLRTAADPLDEDDHRPRHDRDGDHWHKGPHGWTSEGPTGHGDDRLEWLADSYGPLTFCDCDDAATIEAENGATD